MSESKESCVQTARGPLTATSSPESAPTGAITEGGKSMVQAFVGKPAPDFEASAFVSGGFKNIKLSDYKGKWIVLCFYPGDFTFV
jgi:hypothetical protein